MRRNGTGNLFQRILVKIRHFTWRKLFYKIGQLGRVIKSLPSNFSLRPVRYVNKDLYHLLPELAAEVPESHSGSYYRPAGIRIGIITDEFMFNYYKDAAEFIPLTPANYEETIRSGGLTAVLYVSCWRGMKDNEWRGDENQALAADALRLARLNGVKALFQTIEDPPNYEHYLPIAKQADCIFTTDADMIPKYIEDTGNPNTFLLEYGVNPLFHNPVGIHAKDRLTGRYDPSTAFFAGSWSERYPNRCRDTAMLFDGVIASGHPLLVADRNIDIKTPGYRFPSRYRGYTVPAIEHAMLQNVHKLFDFSLNVNTIQSSPTMCAMRVYELQALGCLMLSNYSFAVSRRFPGIFLVNHPEEASFILNGYSAEQLERMRIENLRNVMTDKTLYDRCNFIFACAGIPEHFPDRRVLCVCGEVTPWIEADFAAQEYKEKRLVTEAELARVRTPDDYVAPLSSSHRYGRYYLTDMMNAFKYTDGAYVTKDPALAAGAECYAFVSDADPDPAATVFAPGTDPGGNTLRGFLLDAGELDEPEPVRPAETPSGRDIAVIVPVYNNGTYLRERCFRSLLRSSVFERMRIYLIDDGSDDAATIETIQMLEREYPNVVSYFFPKGGSGSASRPRNKGFELCTEPFVTYLDPDNEAISDGYARLYELLRDSDADMAFGAIYVRRNSEKYVRMGYLFENRRIEDPKTLLLQENFHSQSIQACLIRRSLIADHGIENPVGAVGQDTLFFHELMLNASAVHYLDLPIHIYYAEREGSATNAVNVRFFEKSLILERAQVERFRQYGVYDAYCQRKLDYFVMNWYLEKLRSAAPDQAKACRDVLAEILALYGKTLADYGVRYEEV